MQTSLRGSGGWEAQASNQDLKAEYCGKLAPVLELPGSARLAAFLLLAFSLLLHLGWLDRPNEVVFDEVHFGKFVSNYLTGNYFFDVHPPLAKLLIAAVARLAWVTPDLGFPKIAAPYPNQQFIWLRLLPALFGSLMAPLVYLLALRCTRSGMAAALASVFVLFENSLLVESKFILPDAFLLTFGFLSLYFFMQSKLFFADGEWGAWAAISAAIVVGLCIATKWTGIGFWGLLLVSGICSTASRIWAGEHSRKTMFACIAIIILPLAIYTAVFLIHFVLLPKPGPGNLFMSARFNASQALGYPLRDFPANALELNSEMYKAHSRMGEHQDGSRWYMWPIMRQPVYYWKKDVISIRYDRVLSRKIYLVGNPVVWWISTGFTAMFLFGLAGKFGRQVVRVVQKTRASNFSGVKSVDALLATGYLANLLSFAAIGRVTFLYHYAASLIFSVLIAGVIMRRIPWWKKKVFSGLLALTLLGFLAVAPVTFGVSIDEWPFWGSSELLSVLISN
jgi:dolichyl-phosphate-mannose-protein mannosyltransferase